MKTIRRPGLPGRWSPRPLSYVRQAAACLVIVLVVCGEGIVHREISDTSASERLQPIPERGRSPPLVKGEHIKAQLALLAISTPVGHPGTDSGDTSLPVDYARSLEAAPQLAICDEGFEERQEEPTEKMGVPSCYSSPSADPSQGVWRKSKGGVGESPAMRGNWDFPHVQFKQLGRCKRTWEEEHPGGHEPQPYWVWEPSTCVLKAVTAARFCRVMEGRKGLLLVGDSLTRLFTTTLASILRANAITVDLMGDEWSACEGKLTVRFVRNDYLDIRTSPFDTGLCDPTNGETYTLCSVFADNDTLEKFDTLVVNSGAHTRLGEVYGQAMRAVSKSLAASMRSIHGDDAILVVRNTVPGHWGCTQRMFDGPTNSSVATDLVNAAPPGYKWSTFQDYNRLLKEAFLPEQGWKLLDAFSPTLLRSDSHLGGKDCLHYCLPGPADHWIVLFYNMLLASSTGQ